MKKILDLMTYEDIDAMLQGPHAEYYSGRWSYFKEVVDIINAEDIESSVELGPGHIPVVKNGDLILNSMEDSYGRPGGAHNRIHVFDATIKPWPIADKAYDIFIALQVWEHLDGKQTRAFREVMRIAKRAVLSVPYHWEGGDSDSPGDRAHRDIDMELISDWTLGIKPKKAIEIKRTGTEFSKGPRMICYWEFDE